jgi:hypothetical protein
MFATNRTEKELEESPDLLDEFASPRARDLWNDAQFLVSSDGSLQRFPSVTANAQNHGRCGPTFSALWFVIGAISAYDAFLAMKHRSELAAMEENLIGRALLELDGDDPALFLAVKFLGTIAALGILASLYQLRPRWAMTVAYGVSAFQIGLVVYLSLAGPGPW